jgi:tetratricopeptide (TPR) repeat protein
MVAQLMARLSQDSSFRDRVDRSAQAFAASRRAVAADSLHDGAWHQLGRWHTEASRLWKVQRLIAAHFLGAEGMTEASLDEGIGALERAVALRPNWISYRLDLALAYIDRQRYSGAEAQLQKIAELSPIDPEDPSYVRDAARLSEWVAEKTVEAPRKASLVPLLRR